MACAVAARIIEQRGLDITVSSAGCATADGMPASENSVAVCAQNGLDISQHKSHQLTKEDFIADRIFVCMTAAHSAWLAAQGVPAGNILRFGSEITDPYGADKHRYMQCFLQLEEEVFRIISRIAPECGITVRDAGEEDIAEIARLEEECFAHPWSEKALREELELEDSVLLAAFDGKTLAGYVGMQHTGFTGYITNVAVFETHRRKGVASALLRALRERALALGESEISLEVRSKNEAAIELYKRAGFEYIGKRPGFYNDPADDALIMTARLER